MKAALYARVSTTLQEQEETIASQGGARRMETIRTFIAIELPQDVRQALAQAQSALRSASGEAERWVKWVQPGSIHLTLKFLGETPSSRLEAIGQAMATAVQGRCPFPLRLGQAGCFPNARQPRVLWIGLAGEMESLHSLQAAVEATVAPLGFPTESRRFAPHLTLGRLRDDASPEARRRLGAAIESLHAPDISFVADSISLMRSDLRPTGAVYTCLAEIPLL